MSVGQLQNHISVSVSPPSAATKVSAKNAKNSSPPGEQAPLATSPVEIAPALVPGEPEALPEAASTVEEPRGLLEEQAKKTQRYNYT
eukprot:s2421_g3.t1